MARPACSRSRRQTLLATITCCAAIPAALAGPLDPPPGPVAPTLKTLDQVKPGIIIQSTPYTITAPGVYLLAADLTHTGKDHAITVEAPNVTIDLGGFTLTGPGAESGPSGIINNSSPNLHVRNGTINGFTFGVTSPARGTQVSNITANGCGFGISALATHITDCAATENTRVGITTLEAAYDIPGHAGLTTTGATIIERCSAVANAEGGFALAPGTQIIDSSASINKRFGISTAEACRVNRCTVIGTLADAPTPGYGVSLGSGSDITGSTVRNCESGGIFLASSRVSVRDCTVSANGPFGIGGPGVATAIANGYYTEISGCHVSGHTVAPGYGIAVVGECSITNNTLINNLEAGIASGGGGNRITGNFGRGNGNNAGAFNFSGQIVLYGERNHVEGNTCTGGPRNGIVSFGRNVIIRNACGNNPNANYIFNSSTDIIGPIINRTASGGPITTSDPSANISY